MLFGASAPLSKLLLAHIGPLALSALLYLGAAGGLGVIRVLSEWSAGGREAGLGRADLWPLAGVVGLGGMLGPVLMLAGLQRISALAGSLLLNLEAPFTAALAVLLFGEHLGRRGVCAVAAIVAGAAALSWQPGEFRAEAIGALAVVAACACWAVDNNLTQLLSLHEPAAVAQVKALGASVCMLVIAAVAGSPFGSAVQMGSALIVGALSYGLSLYLAVCAFRVLGAAREAACFATAPFIGGALSMLIFMEAPGVHELLAAALMAAGVALMMSERHGHEHAHAELLHDHIHVHDEHHAHHEAAVAEPHAHPHRHSPLTHAHPHTPDAHHRHAH